MVKTKAEELLNKYEKNGQKNIRKIYGYLPEEKKSDFLKELEATDPELIGGLFLRFTERKNKEDKKIFDNVSPACVTEKADITEEKLNALEKSGAELNRSGKTAVVTMAGGQGTRLGFEGPKGTYIIDTDRNKSFFELQSDYILEKTGGKAPWYIMTSNINHDDTEKFFRENNFFGYPEENVKFFIQDRIAAVDEEGRPVFDAEGNIYRTPNGNGGCFTSMKKAGIIRDMRKRGVEFVFVCGVDNCLVKPCDPVFVGFAAETGSDITAKSVKKAYPTEKTGIFCIRNGKPGVMEYTEMPEELKFLTDEKGGLVYSDVNIVSYIFRTDYVERVSEMQSEYHFAEKRQEFYLWTERGTLEKTEGTCIKFELFLFDLFEYGNSMSVLRTDREREFAPVKNKTGPDSPETALPLLRKQW